MPPLVEGPGFCLSPPICAVRSPSYSAPQGVITAREFLRGKHIIGRPTPHPLKDTEYLIEKRKFY